MSKRFALMLVVVLFILTSADVAYAAPLYESYTYSYWGEPVSAPQAYLPSRIIDGDELGIGNFKNPSDISVNSNNEIYLVDSGNNRIIVIDSTWHVLKVIDGFINNDTEDSFNNPQGIFITEQDDIYVADTDNGRIVQLNKDYDLVRIIGAPEADIITEGFEYRPTKLVVDKSRRIYVIARNVNQGIIELDRDGVFRGYIGASRVTANPIEYFWRRFATYEQKQRMLLFVPTEYNNITIDEEGFLYVTTSALLPWDVLAAITARDKSDRVALIRRLNLTGIDVLNRRGFFPPVGDVKFPFQGSITGHSTLIDICIKENGVYSVLDSKRGRIFTYDFDGNLLYVFGGLGNSEGTFKNPSAMEFINGQYVILDSAVNRLTIFEPTAYAELINRAIELHFVGKYDESAEVWDTILKYNANSELAYIGMGNAFLRQDEFKEAMESFQLGNDRDGYNRAFQLYRKELISSNFTILLLSLLLLIILLRFVTKRFGAMVYNPERKGFLYKLIFNLKFSFFLLFRPLKGFWELKNEKRGTIKAALTIVLLLTVTYVMRRQYTGFLFNYNNLTRLNIYVELASVLLPFTLWCVANWGLTTLMDGEGSARDIIIYSAYALVPLIVINVPLIFLSHIITIEEGAFYNFFSILSLLWSGLLILVGTMSIHQYSMKKTLFTTLLIVIGMGVLGFIAVLFLNVIQQMYNFVYNAYRELSFRL